MSNSTKCPVCGAELRQDFNFCPECGERFSKIGEIKKKTEEEKRKELTKTIKCPSCGETSQIQGSMGARITVICPKCNTKGFFQFR